MYYIKKGEIYNANLKKIRQNTTLPFARIDAKIAEAKTKGIDIISLGVGDPDTPTIQTVVDAMHKAVDNPKNHDYPPYNGTEAFRKASADWMKERFGVELNPEAEVLAKYRFKRSDSTCFLCFCRPRRCYFMSGPRVSCVSKRNNFSRRRALFYAASS